MTFFMKYKYSARIETNGAIRITDASLTKEVMMAMAIMYYRYMCKNENVTKITTQLSYNKIKNDLFLKQLNLPQKNVRKLLFIPLFLDCLRTVLTPCLRASTHLYHLE